MAVDRLEGALSTLGIKAPVRAGTTANITLSGLQTIDGVALAADDRVLVKNQTTTTENGIYEADTGSWTRTADFDANADITKGTLVLITDGSTLAGQVFELTSTNPIVIGTSAISFTLYTSAPVTLPLAVASGGTGTTTADGAAGTFGIVRCTAVAGTNSITCTIQSTVTAYVTNQLFELTPANTNTGATTLTPTPSGGGPLAGKNIFANGAALTAGALVVGVPVLLLYDGTQFNIIGSFANAADVLDSVFRIVDNGDPTKKIAFEASGITAATTRTITMPDAAVDLQYARAASDTIAGGIEIATQAEQETGTDVGRAVTPGRQHFHPSAAKGWVKADAGGTINASYNVTSITDGGTGLLTVTWATDFSSADYCAAVSHLVGATVSISRFTAQAAGTIDAIDELAAGTDTDPTSWFITAFGDQA